MKTKILSKAFFILLVSSILLTSCIYSPNNKITGSGPLPKFKYKVTYGFGRTTIYDFTTGDIIYMKDGRIKFESYNNGHPDTVIVGGTYLIENYR